LAGEAELRWKLECAAAHGKAAAIAENHLSDAEASGARASGREAEIRSGSENRPLASSCARERKSKREN
jgi:hypothetical protein